MARFARVLKGRRVVRREFGEGARKRRGKIGWIDLSAVIFFTLAASFCFCFYLFVSQTWRSHSLSVTRQNIKPLHFLLPIPVPPIFLQHSHVVPFLFVSPQKSHTGTPPKSKPRDIF